MTTNIDPNISATKNGAPPRILVNVTFATGTFTAKNVAGTTLATNATQKGLVDKVLAALRAAGPYSNGAWVDFHMPLNTGSYIESVMIEQGMKLSTQYYSGDSEA